jgi:hypothetical protein
VTREQETSDAKSLVRELVARVNSGGDGWALLSESPVVTVNGTTPLSGRYPGVELIRGILLDTARSVVSSLNFEIAQLIGDTKRVAALLVVRGFSVSGTPLNTEGLLCGCAFHVHASRIREITFFPDTSLIEMGLFGRRYVPDA